MSPKQAKRRHEEDDEESLDTFAAHVVGLNKQFSSWVARQSTQSPSLLWIEGVKDYVKHAESLLEQHRDALAAANGPASKVAAHAPSSVPSTSSAAFSFPAAAPSSGYPSTGVPADSSAVPSTSTQSTWGGFAAPAPAADKAVPAFGSSATAGKDKDAGAAPTPLFAFGASAPFAAKTTSMFRSAPALAAAEAAAPASSAAAAAASIFGSFGSTAASSAAAASTSAQALGFGTVTSSASSAAGSTSLFGASAGAAAPSFTFGGSNAADDGVADAPAGASNSFSFGAGKGAASFSRAGPTDLGFGAPAAATGAAGGSSASAAGLPPAGFSFGVKASEQGGPTPSLNAGFSFAPATGTGFSFGTASTGGFAFGGAAAGGGGEDDEGADAPEPEAPVDEYAANTQGIQADESNEVLAKFKTHAHLGVRGADGKVSWIKKGTGLLTLRKPRSEAGKPFVVFGLENGKVLLSAYVSKSLKLVLNEASASLAFSAAITEDGATAVKSVSFVFGKGGSELGKKKAQEFKVAVTKAQEGMAEPAAPPA